MEKKNKYIIMRRKLILLVIFKITLSSCEQKISIKKAAFTAINPLAYTDVVYISNKDTVLVSTFDGRIAQRIHGKEKETLVLQIPDEIYSLAYDSITHRIYASTLNSGIFIIDAKNKAIIDRLTLEKTWISNIFLSTDGNILAGRSADRKNHIWNLKNDQALITLPDSLSTYRITGISKNSSIILKGKGTYLFWHPLKNLIEKEVKINGNLAAIDASNNMLLINDTNFQYYNAAIDSTSPKKQHEDWPYYVKEQDTTLRIPLQLALTVGELTEEYIFTAGIDRSIRKWNKTNGQHLEDIIKHKATISAMDIAPDASQLVSVDLKGGILFYEIHKN
ncbi:hypothetical protein [Cellulophaga sp. Hel_I_12]|uniref:hypothetical protein n=1 Tax=Cellulophaga sp. Hel_I_12 TaxID=1249972 RepID=UPI00064911E7|nr:hypothetical protein [Cellulophaga sp. Hel_I_12]